MTEPIKTYSIEEVEEFISGAGLPEFRAGQLLEWIYGKAVHSYEEMTNLPKPMREQLALAFPLHVPEVVARQLSTDGTRKYLLEFHDGTRTETVGLPSQDGRLTVCVSSQAGCAMACAFCATGMQGLARNLAPGEIVDQVLTVQRDFNRTVTNVVVMGQGEPFAHYDATLAALRIMNHPKLLNIGSRRITVSTCGIIDGINRFMREDGQFTLAVSLHAARQEVRDRLMPAMQSQRLGALRKALENYANATGRRFSLEYALIAGTNDSPEDLAALEKFCRRLLCHVNLIPLNDIEEAPFKPAPQRLMAVWRDELEKAGIPVSIRQSRGPDILAACGQLANHS